MRRVPRRPKVDEHHRRRSVGGSHRDVPAELKEAWMAENTAQWSGGSAFPPGFAEVVRGEERP